MKYSGSPTGECKVPDKEERPDRWCEQNSQAPEHERTASEEGTKERYTVASTRGSGSRARDGDCKGSRRVHVTATQPDRLSIRLHGGGYYRGSRGCASCNMYLAAKSEAKIWSE